MFSLGFHLSALILEFKCVDILVHVFVFQKPSKLLVPKVCSADPKGSATISQGIRGFVSIMDTLKFDVLWKIVAQLFQLATVEYPGILFGGGGGFKQFS